MAYTTHTYVKKIIFGYLYHHSYIASYPTNMCIYVRRQLRVGMGSVGWGWIVYVLCNKIVAHT